MVIMQKRAASTRLYDTTTAAIPKRTRCIVLAECICSQQASVCGSYLVLRLIREGLLETVRSKDVSLLFESYQAMRNDRIERKVCDAFRVGCCVLCCTIRTTAHDQHSDSQVDRHATDYEAPKKWTF